MSRASPVAPESKRGVLDWIEVIGNKFPETALLFVLLAALVTVISAAGSAMGWKVQPVQVTVEKIETRGLPAGV